jgi:hypothetical protein
MNAKETLNKIKVALGIQVSLETMKLENGVEIEAEVFEAGYEVFIITEGDKVALPVGEYVLEDSKVLVVVEEGIISEIKEASEEAPKEEEEVSEPEQPMAEPELAAENATPKKVVESVSKETHFSQEDIDVLNARIKELEAELQLSKVEVTEEKEEVELAAIPVVHNPEVKTESKKKFHFESQKRNMTTQDRVFAKLFKN